jgi:two-component sensor histidine kinase
MRPRLIAWSHEWQHKESRITPEMINRHFVRPTLSQKIQSGELDGGDGATFRNELIVPTSSFIFYFGKPDASLADSTMEYRILGGRYTDSNWTKTGHLIMMDGLTGDERYSLEVRYRSNPENTQVYTFVTKPWWYQRSWLKWLTGGVLFLLILLLINASYRRKLAKEKAKKAGLADRLRNMQTQLNPHFIFNALGSIQALMSRQENDKAHQYLSTFGSLLRNVLTNSNHDNTTLDQEIRSLESYLQLEQLRFQFRYNIAVAQDIQTTTVSLPVMLLQPLVENAIRHGIDGMEEKGQISILFNRDNNNLYAVIEDNGKGFDTTRPTTGYGLKLVKEKIQLINTLQEQQTIQLDMQSTNVGTAVHLTFKNWLA